MRLKRTGLAFGYTDFMKPSAWITNPVDHSNSKFLKM